MVSEKVFLNLIVVVISRVHMFSRRIHWGKVAIVWEFKELPLKGFCKEFRFSSIAADEFPVLRVLKHIWLGLNIC